MLNTVVLAAGADVSTGEALSFWILAPVALAGAIGMVIARNAVHSALSLVATMMCLGLFYVIEQGPFLGLVQIIVYTGAIMILFLFVLMLIGRDSSDSLVETLRGQRVAALLSGLAFALLVAVTLGRAFTDKPPKNLVAANGGANNAGNVNNIAHKLFSDYLFAFELTSALLIVAAVGAMILAHIEREGPRPTQKSLARERIRSGRPQPLPGPGVLSSGNAVGTPALLPDGSIATESLLGNATTVNVGAGSPSSARELDR
ncbi:NADH-quinone oxidoreductase subunit J [Jatrophihabitans telluris]|uniref:NADH-quinone oxidoreductase subunit J n=1 Tax=Jatrophihabitans telluris TaxID=2038343 RepID=A0ABY4QWM9_9ACTN|nr:NADH-quinone oxidoreductase subunit J [Jatrophihabitans telluris]UQX88061.1 NADH-quinone oxidoreductase subunit J [Jatrophihabitans telluris]